ncbi:MAG: hypothetical protein WCF06_08410, partial [Nitrososphaeraceae archaeon]
IDSSSLFFFNEKNGNGDDNYYSHHYHLEYTAAAMLKYRITLLFHTYYIDLRLKYSENVLCCITLLSVNNSRNIMPS